MKLYIGDYLRDTGTLTLAQHGAYLRLLFAQYATEKPLPNQKANLHRLAGAMTRVECAAVDFVADRYFEIGPDEVRHNKRAEDEIAKARVAIEVASENGKKGGRPPKKQIPPDGTGVEPTGFPEANQSTNRNHYEAQSSPTPTPAPVPAPLDAVASPGDISPAVASASSVRTSGLHAEERRGDSHRGVGMTHAADALPDAIKQRAPKE